MRVEKINAGNFFSKNLFMLQRAFKFTMTLQNALLLSLFIIFSANTAQAVTTGTIDGTYDFGAVGAVDSGGAGFKTQGDKFVISNALQGDWPPVIYLASTNTGTFTIKAEGGSTMKTCTVTDLVMGMAGGSIGLDVFTITFKDDIKREQTCLFRRTARSYRTHENSLISRKLVIMFHINT